MDLSHTLGFIGGLGPTEMIVILVVLLLLFGSRLPSIMRKLGSSAREFKKGVNEGLGEDDSAPTVQRHTEGTQARGETEAEPRAQADAPSPREREL